MGEAKRKRDRRSPVEREALRLTHELANDGKLIEGGFDAFVVISKIDAADPRLPALRDAYMHGAEHLWSSIMATLDPGVEETPDDLRRMDAIHAELTAWREHKLAAMAQSYPTKGSA